MADTWRRSPNVEELLLKLVAGTADAYEQELAAALIAASEHIPLPEKRGRGRPPQKIHSLEHIQLVDVVDDLIEFFSGKGIEKAKDAAMNEVVALEAREGSHLTVGTVERKYKRGAAELRKVDTKFAGWVDARACVLRSQAKVVDMDNAAHLEATLEEAAAKWCRHSKFRAQIWYKRGKLALART